MRASIARLVTAIVWLCGNRAYGTNPSLAIFVRKQSSTGQWSAGWTDLIEAHLARPGGLSRDEQRGIGEIHGMVRVGRSGFQVKSAWSSSGLTETHDTAVHARFDRPLPNSRHTVSRRSPPSSRLSVGSVYPSMLPAVVRKAMVPIS
jgi:hypothetical protein